MKKINKIVVLTLCIGLLISIVSTFEYKVNALSYSEMVEQSKQFLEDGKTEAGSVDVSGITSEFVPLGQILTMIGGGIMVAVTTYMGIKYLTASPEGQAKLKQQLIGVIVSGIIIFGAYYIWSTVLKIVENFE